MAPAAAGHLSQIPFDADDSSATHLRLTAALLGRGFPNAPNRWPRWGLEPWPPTGCGFLRTVFGLVIQQCPGIVRNVVLGESVAIGVNDCVEFRIAGVQVGRCILKVSGRITESCCAGKKIVDRPLVVGERLSHRRLRGQQESNRFLTTSQPAAKIVYVCA